MRYTKKSNSGYTLQELIGVISIILALAAVSILATSLTRCAMRESALNREITLTNSAYQNFLAAGGPPGTTKEEILADLHEPYNGVGPFLIAGVNSTLAEDMQWEDSVKRFIRVPGWTCANAGSGGGSGTPTPAPSSTPSGSSTPTPTASPTPSPTPLIDLTISAPAYMEMWSYGTVTLQVASLTGSTIPGATITVPMPTGFYNVLPSAPADDMTAFIEEEGTFEEAALGYGYPDVASMLADWGYASEQEMATDWYGGIWLNTFTWTGDVTSGGETIEIEVFVNDQANTASPNLLPATVVASELTDTKSASVLVVNPGALSTLQVTQSFVPPSIAYGGTATLVTTISSLAGPMDGSLVVTLPSLTVTTMDSNADYSTAGEIHWSGNTASQTITTGISAPGWGDYGANAVISTSSGSANAYAQLHVDAPSPPPDITSVFVAGGQTEFTSGDFMPLEFTANNGPFTSVEWRWAWNEYQFFGNTLASNIAPEFNGEYYGDWVYKVWAQVGNITGTTSSNSFGGALQPGDTGAASGGASTGGYNISGDQLLSITIHPKPVIRNQPSFDGSRVFTDPYPWQSVQWYVGADPVASGDSLYLPLQAPESPDTVGSVTLGSQTYYSGNTISVWGRATNHMGRYIDSAPVTCTVPYYQWDTYPFGWVWVPTP